MLWTLHTIGWQLGLSIMGFRHFRVPAWLYSSTGDVSTGLPSTKDKPLYLAPLGLLEE